MADKKNILVVDDDAMMADILSDILSYKGYQVQSVGNGPDAIKAISQNPIDLILLDLLLPGVDGIETLKKILQIKPLTTVVMMSGHGTIPAAVESTLLGAYDWLEKPLEKERVLLTVRNALEKSTFLQEKEILLVEAKKRYGMVGTSPALQRVYFLIDKVAPTNATVLITGQSGTGKELVARAIHNNSRRAAFPFIQLNCAAIPDALIESELFGHVKGAFTGAMADRKGKFQLADNGTLFMDEIADLSPMAQAKALRAIETGDMEKVGCERTEKVNVRLVAATNKDLKKMVAQGAFREDLFHRINVIEIFIPPLKERPEDILPLVNHFSEKFCTQNNLPKKALTPGAEAALLAHSWTGNVRELKHFIEKLLVLTEESRIGGQLVAHLLNYPQLETFLPDSRTFKQAKESFEKSFLLHALTANDWNIMKTAENLGIERSVFYKKMEKYRIRKSQKEDK